MTKYIVILILSMGLFAGPASALEVTPEKTITLGDGLEICVTCLTGQEKDFWGESFVVPAGTGNYEHVAYVLMKIVTTLELTAVEGVATPQGFLLDLAIYAADFFGGGDWTRGNEVASSTGAGVLMGVELDFNVSEYWLLEYKTVVPKGISPTQYMVSGSVITTSPVPVPAAVWLFGTAILGLLGFRRKSRAMTPA